MILFHRTNPQSARDILQQGFRDGTGNYLTDHTFSGVWLSDTPLDENEGAFGDILLEVNVDMQEAELREHEWIEEGKPYREFLVPAAKINSRMKVRIVEDRRQERPPSDDRENE